MKDGILFFLIVISFAQNLYGQNITGRVMLDGEPASFATIQSTNGKNTVADENGLFSISIDTSIIKLHIRYAGAIALDTIISCHEKNCIIEIQLTANAQPLQEVVISGGWKEMDRSQSPVTIDIFKPEYLQKNGATELFEAIQLVNGIRPQINCNVCQAGDIHIHGMEGPYTMISMDGMPLVNGLGTVYGLLGIPLSLIERIEVIKGPASTLFGSDAMAGVINIITKNPQTAPRFSMHFNISTWLENSVDAGGVFSIRKHRWLGSISGQFQPLIIDNNQDGFMDLVRLEQGSAWVKYQLERKHRRVFQSMIRYVHENRLGGQLQYKHELRGSDSIYGESIYTRRGEWLLHYQLPFKEQFHFQSSYVLHFQDSWYGNVPFKAIQHTTFHQLYWMKTLKKHDLLIGISGRWNFYDDNTTATYSDDSTSAMNIPSVFYTPGVYIQHQWNINPMHTILYGMRLDYHPDHGIVYSPRLNYKITIKKHHHIRLNAGKGFRVVNLFTEEHAALSGSIKVMIEEKLNPEEAINSTLQYEGNFILKNGLVRIDAGLFYTHFFNQIIPDYDTDPNLIIYKNLSGYGHSRGINLQIEWQTDWGLVLRKGITCADVSVKQSETEPLKRLIHAPIWSGMWQASYQIKKFPVTIDFTGTWTGPMRLPIQKNDFRPEYSPWFSIANLQVVYTLKNGLEFTVGIKNLFNFLPKHPILRSHDPFDQWVNDPIDNPQGYTFDTSYNYAPLQGIRAFGGLRFILK